MKSLCLRASPRAGHMQGSISIREDAENSSASLTPSSLQSTKKSQKRTRACHHWLEEKMGQEDMQEEDDL
ncbi:hypothetical protein E2C01_076219 [Portunus trituberculatus]|uniref:Uncharacterized protein n=1 Tax=Portunus trituberculatus TaxID=210409 RepID=A0A5B7IN24_PORTR|nr:hypothetical protein [Portunus trituberculatus]